MKKIILSAIIAACALTANAQVWLGGELGLTSLTEKLGGNELTTTALEVSPEIGYKLNDKWDVAAKLTFAHHENIDNLYGYSLPVADVDVNAYGINPYVRYTFAKTGNLSLFVDGGISYVTMHMKGIDDNVNAFGIGFNPGLAYSLSDKVSLVAHIGDLSYTNYKFDKFKTNIFNLGLKNSISFGAYVAL